MKLSLFPYLDEPVGGIVDLGRYLDARGWDGLYIADHFMGDGGDFGIEGAPVHEATATLAGLATATSNIRLASLVLSVTYRHPAVVANWASTVDHLSDGRFTLGVGAGWQVNEHQQYGIALGGPSQRLDRFEEAVIVLRGLLGPNQRTDLDGQHFVVTDAIAEPKPIQKPLPLLIGGKGDRMLGLVARYADQWNHWSTPQTFRNRADVLDAWCERIGRDPATIHRSTQALVLLTENPAEANRFVERFAPRPALAGSPALFAEACANWIDVGVDEVIVSDLALGTGNQRRDAVEALSESVASLRT